MPKSPEPDAVGSGSPAVAVHDANRRWLNCDVQATFAYAKNMITKSRYIFLAAISLFIFTGCATRETTYSTVMEGMSRNVLRANFGEPLQIEPRASGGEDWYYNFSSWQAQPTGSSGTTEDFGEQTSYATAGLAFSQRVLELPVHVSSEGFVVPPLPKGKVVKK